MKAENEKLSLGEEAQSDTIVWLTAEETACILRVHVTTVHEMCRQKKLPAMKVGRDWRISANGLQKKAEIGDAYNQLIVAAAELSAEKAVARILANLAQAFDSGYSHNGSGNKVVA